MTSGSYGSLPSWPFSTIGVWSAKTWTGADGKYETYAGERRSKWNSYNSTSSKLRCTNNLCTLRGTYTGPYGDWPVGAVHNIAGLSELRSVSHPPISGSVSAAAQSRLLAKLLSKVKSSDFNLGVELGQLNQTVDLLSGNLRKLGGAALAIRRGDFSSAARALGTRPRSTNLRVGDIPGRWLELQYGWLPLLSSSFEAAKAFEAISNGPRSKLFRASVAESVEVDASSTPTRFSCIYKGVRKRYLQFELYEEMSVQRQLGLVDPLSVVWELTPWSFVVDWFLPIGEYLSNLNQIPHLNGRWLVTDVAKIGFQRPIWTWKDSGTQWIEVYSPVFHKGNYVNVSIVKPPDIEWGTTVMTRSPLSSPPKVPLPRFNLGGVNSSRRFWNAVSLAYQRFLR